MPRGRPWSSPVGRVFSQGGQRATLGNAAKMRRVFEFLLGYATTASGGPATCGFPPVIARGVNLLRILGILRRRSTGALITLRTRPSMGRYQWLRIAREPGTDFPRCTTKSSQHRLGTNFESPCCRSSGAYEKLQRAADVRARSRCKAKLTAG
jgi:hypothetical protein